MSLAVGNEDTDGTYKVSYIATSQLQRILSSTVMYFIQQLNSSDTSQQSVEESINIVVSFKYQWVH